MKIMIYLDGSDLSFNVSSVSRSRCMLNTMTSLIEWVLLRVMRVTSRGYLAVSCTHTRSIL
jgi:hypothetical protein